MKAIVTRYHGPSEIKGSRISATAEGRGNRIVVSYDHASDNPHADVALELARKLGWRGTLIEGGLPNRDRVFVFAEGDRFLI